MKYNFVIICFFIEIYFNIINCQCIYKGTLQSSKFREYFSETSDEKCREWAVGWSDKPKNVLILFDNSRVYANCSSDNVLIYDDNKNVVLDFCEMKKSRNSIYTIHNSKNLFIQFKYGSKGIFSVAFEWLIKDTNLIQTTNLVSDTALSSTTTTLTSTSTTRISTTTASITTTRAPTTITTTTTTTKKTSSSTLPPDDYYYYYVEEVTQPTTSTTSKPSTQSTPRPSTCGSPQIPMSLNGLRIIGGAQAAPNSHPWQAFVTNNLGLVCGGSLINNNYVLTAAHCVVNPGSYKVYLGSHDISKSEFTRQTISVSKIIIHENYQPKNFFANDIAILKLETPATYTREISPICLSTRTPSPNSQAIVSGWGVTADFGPVSNILNQVSIQIKDRSFCNNLFIRTDNSQICGGSSGSNNLIKDSCKGDSGGPLIIRENDGKYYLNGIVSYGGIFCNGNGVYINVAHYLDWIDNKMKIN